MRNDHFIRNAKWATRHDAGTPILARVASFTLQLLGLAAFMTIAAMVIVFFV